MKTINSNNCEAWMLDYFEGNLNSSQSNALLQFLEAHPDWKRVFDEYAASEEPAALNPQSAEYVSPALYAEPSGRDEDLIALTEGQLNNADSKRLLQQISTDEKLASDYAKYQLIRLKPDMEIQFENKRKLKKTAVVIPLILRYSAVAAMLCGALVAAWVFNYTSTPDQNFAEETPIENNVDQLSEEEVISHKDPIEQLENLADNPKSENIKVKVNSDAEVFPNTDSQQNKFASAENQVSAESTPEPVNKIALAAIELQPISNSLFHPSARHASPGKPGGELPTAAIQWTEDEQTDGIAGLITNIGQNLLGKVKEVADEQIVLEQQNNPEEEVYTSTFKLGSFEVYRSRSKK